MSEAVVVIPPQVRCAIYTRKSTEEGLEKEFNSLQAQREAAEAFIASQRQEGWLPQPLGCESLKIRSECTLACESHENARSACS